jgi:hypothetical protein
MGVGRGQGKGRQPGPSCRTNPGPTLLTPFAARILSALFKRLPLRNPSLLRGTLAPEILPIRIGLPRLF